MRLRFLFLAAGILFFLVLVMTFFVSAQSIIGVSPSDVNFKGVLRGGYAERVVTISIDSENPAKVEVDPRGEIADWIGFSSLNNSVSKGNPWRLNLIVEPPSDVPNGNYTGFVRVRIDSEEVNTQEGHATGTVVPVIDIAVNVEVTDIEVLECGARSFAVNSVEKGEDLTLSFEFLNRGNIRLKPRVSFDIWDQEQSFIVKSGEVSGNDVLPTKTEKINLNVPVSELDIEQYWLDVSELNCFASETLTFDIFEPGTLRANGEITGIASKVWAEVGETIPIAVGFRNTGEKNLLAEFRGQITLDGRIIQLLESERTSVLEGESSNFTFFFTPKNSGRYIVSGRVFYDTKRTFEASTVVNVLASGLNWKGILNIAMYLALAVIAGLLIYKIRNERRKRQRFFDVK